MATDPTAPDLDLLFGEALAVATEHPDVRSALDELKRLDPATDFDDALSNELRRTKAEILRSAPSETERLIAMQRELGAAVSRAVETRLASDPEIWARYEQVRTTGSTADLRALVASISAGLQVDGQPATELDSAVANESTARKLALDAIVERGVLEVARPWLTRQLDPHRERRYGRELQADSAPGLYEMANPENEIPTDAATRLEQLLSQRRGGSIGVSGPRGIGKSTLIAAICRRPIEGRTWRISVQVAAPVEYAPLEFVLYLFAKVCEKAVPQVVPPQRADTRTHSDAGRRLAIVLAAMAAVGAGSAAVLVFTAWLAGLLSTSEERRLSTAIVATGLATTVAVGVLVTRATSTSFDDRYTRSPMIPSLADYASWVRLEYSRTLDRPFAPSLGLLAAAILAAVAIALFVFGSPTNGVDDTTLVGVGLVAAGGFTAVVAEVSRAWPKRRLYEFQFEADGGRMPNEWRIQFPIIVANGMAFIAVVFLASGVLPLVLAAAARPEPIELARASVFAGLAAVLVRAVFQLTRDRRRDGPQRSPFPDSMLLGGSLEGEALNLLEAIHFQQTLTTGSTAKVSLDSVLGFPFSAEASTSASRALSARAWSLPEAIDRFNGFVERAGAEGSVIIGIDELDKMSHENAEKFLNQIKAIFVTANTHFLVSVSEDAVADFERRGLPFRDVFDSSFDDVVVLRYLNLAETYLLLSRRVIGLPIAFAALCYCLSGGLPRDVLRSARRLFEVRATSGDTRLSQLSSALLADEFLGKQAATAVAMRRDQGPNLAPALDWLGRLRVEDATEAGIVANANPALMPTGSAIGTSAGNDVRDLVDEFVGYWYFCATLRDVFGSSLDYARLISAERAAVSGGTFDELARARQDFAVSTGVAWERISAFRRSWGLKAIDRTPTGSSLASPA